MTGLISTPQRRRLRQSVEPIAELSTPWVLTLPFVPVLSVALVYVGAFTATRGVDPGFPPGFPLFLLGVAGWLVVSGLFWHWDAETWRASAPFRRPTPAEVGASLLAAGLGIGIMVIGNNAAVAVGATPHHLGRVTTSVGLVSFVFGAVVTAPVTEEVLFRGMLFGHLASHDYGIEVAAVVSMVLFGLTHVFIAGIVSVVITTFVGGPLVALRIKYDNLVGAWLMHLVVNGWGLLTALAVLPTPW